MEKQAKIAIIDHHDSFTFNLVQLLEETGAKVTIFTYPKFLIPEITSFDGIILSPGPGTPNNYPKSIELIGKLKGKVPILGICMGLQIILTYFGGSLRNLEEVNHGEKVKIIKKGAMSLWEGLIFPIGVGLYHSWTAVKTNFPDEINITAETTEGLIMGIKHAVFSLEAVQFHPESYMTDNGNRMISNWIATL